MAYASITYTSASGTTFALTNSSGDPIEYLRQNDISVTVNGVLKTLTTDYTFNSAGTAIVLNTAVSGATIVIARTTDIADATVSFTAGSTLTAQDLNNSDKQNRFALQEFSDIYGALTTGTGDLSALGGFIGSAETWLSDNAHAPTTGAVDTRVDSKIDTALTTDVVAGDSITVTDNSPSSGQITIGVTNASISTAKLVDSSVTTAKIADGNVTTAKILDANVTTAKLADSNVTTAKIADSAVTSAKIADGTIVAGDIAADAVTTAKILDNNVTTGKLADGAVTTAKLADSSVTSAKIVDGTIVAGDLASDSVTTAKIVDSNVTTAKINDSAVTTGKIADSAVTAIKIADGVITSAKLNAATVVTAAEQAACTPDDVTFFTTSASDGRYVNVTGDSMAGALAMGSNKITGLGAPTANADAATKQYVDTSVAAGVGDADYGDITVSGTGTVWTIDSGVVTSAKIADGTIVNGDINAAAAIAGTKISPDFGSQNVTTTGTVTGASLSPTSSTAPTNGVYLPAANTVGISTNGSGRLFIASNGNVGVGRSTSINERLSVQDTSLTSTTVGANVVAGFRANAANADVSIALTDGVSSSAQFGQIAGSLYWYTNGGERMRLDGSGRLGVGVSAPGAVLHAASTGAGIQEVQWLRNGQSVAADVGSALVFTGTTNDNGLARISGAFAGAATTDGAYMAFSTRAVTTGTLTERLRITAGGSVGIGTSSPSGPIHVTASSNGYISHTFSNTSNGSSAVNRIQIGNDASDGVGQIVVYGSQHSTLANTLDVTNAVNAPIRLLTNNTEKVRITGAGNVGIGTTSVSNKFVVSNGGAEGYEISPGFASNDNLLLSINRSGGVYCGNTQNASFHRWLIQDNEKARIDSSGRLLVGTSSWSSSDKLVVRGNTSGDDEARFSLVRGTAPAADQNIGVLHFQQGSGNEGARITALRDGGTWTAGSSHPSRLTFSTTADGASSPTERMRIGQSGQIGTYTTGNYAFGVNTSASAGTSSAIYFGNRNSSDTAGSGGTTVYYVWSNGNVQNTNGSFTAISDAKLKENIVDASSQWNDLKAIKIRNWNFKEETRYETHRQIGPIAQELETVCPGLVFETPDRDEEGNETGEVTKGVNQSVLYMKAVKALQEAMERIEQLEAKVAALESA